MQSMAFSTQHSTPYRTIPIAVAVIAEKLQKKATTTAAATTTPNKITTFSLHFNLIVDYFMV